MTGLSDYFEYICRATQVRRDKRLFIQDVKLALTTALTSSIFIVHWLVVGSIIVRTDLWSTLNCFSGKFSATSDTCNKPQFLFNFSQQVVRREIWRMEHWTASFHSEWLVQIHTSQAFILGLLRCGLGSWKMRAFKRHPRRHALDF